MVPLGPLRYIFRTYFQRLVVETYRETRGDLVADEQSRRDTMEICPFCGRSFKRLKSHIPHCKMAPVTKDTKVSKASPQPRVSVSAVERSSPTKPKKLTANQRGHSDEKAAVASAGSGAKARQNKKPKEQEALAGGSGVRVNAKELKRKGQEGAESQRENSSPVREAMFPVSKGAGERGVTAAVGGLRSYEESTVPRGKSPANSPRKQRLPVSELQLPESPKGGAVGQGSAGEVSVARIQAVERALLRPPHARTRFWKDVAGADQLPWRSGSLAGEHRGRTKTSVWEHIKQGLSCRAPSSSPNQQAVFGVGETARLPSADPKETGRSSKLSSGVHRETEDKETSRQTSLTNQGRETDRQTSLTNQDEPMRWPSPSTVQNEPTSRPSLSTGQHRATGRLTSLTNQERETGKFTSSTNQETASSRLGVGVKSPAENQSRPVDPFSSPIRGTDLEPGRETHPPLGLEGVSELAAAYKGIGVTLFPLRFHARTECVQNTDTPIHTEHVQQEAPPTTDHRKDRALMEVRLAELPEWLTSRPPLTPRRTVAAVQRGWRWYYSKYIDVRKGGVGGVAMLLAGYCVLSYIWNYPHLKCDRWRKYH
ncbi:hypothetical protein GJAV_G00141270 [Gymnothorax javanicus]|nr:hypothetical protein GJAV_G00141270 [Gymnothorax javanicus]